MRRGLVHAIAWSFATGAAVTLSWWGVHTVMSGTAYDRPRAVPISVGTRATEAPVSSSTHRALPSPTPSPSASRSTSPPSPRSSPRASSAAPSGGHAPAAPAPSAASGNVESYPTRGGRVVLELAADSAKLVSATPEPEWSMQVWTNAEWIRVDFTEGSGATVSVFCTWNGHPPSVEVVEQ
ncbi:MULTISPECIES: hypothetical protein [Streptomyces]|uniref:Secreted protein n=2 Tax=Streptomyces TaxID=1883 RepID=A0ABU2RBJ6_9ACTN|nr:hypothetical protein [Streptomyces sp. DSM 41770]MDT0426236.1 hypothetical protein [Streptomyces sp. DSM 41770]